jgi:predicted dehydrogenase
MKQLIDEGFIGQLHSVSVTVFRSPSADPAHRPRDRHGDAARSGGILGALGSHYVAALRWWFGEVHAVCGTVLTAVEERAIPGASVTPRVDADDNAAFVVRFASGALGTVHLCSTAATEIGEEIVATGSDGVLAIRDNGQLVGARSGEALLPMMPSSKIVATDPATADARQVRAFSILFGEWVLAMRTGADASPSFEDGAKVQEIIDAVTRSQQLSRWIDLSGNKWPV